MGGLLCPLPHVCQALLTSLLSPLLLLLVRMRLPGAHTRQQTDGPFVYIVVLATRPHLQRRGLATALLSALLCAADALGVPSYIEATTHENARLYARLGFETVKVCQGGNGAADAMFMYTGAALYMR